MSVDDGSIPSDEDPSEDEDAIADTVRDGDEAARTAFGNGLYNADEVNDTVFEELDLHPEIVGEVQAAWAAFLRSTDSREAAGEAIYAALFESAPNLQPLFKTPRAVMAMRFMSGLHQIIGSLNEPRGLKVLVETLGFQHLDLEVTTPRTAIFRDAIVDLLQIELGSVFTAQASEGFRTMLNYVGGAYIYVRKHYASRLRVLASSWATANKRKVQGGADEQDTGHGETERATSVDIEKVEDAGAAVAKKRSGKLSFWGASSPKGRKRAEEQASKEAGGNNTAVPTTYPEMFRFNAAVMGFASRIWMMEVLASFDTIVTNVSNSYRLQEECDVLSLRMAKYKGSICLNEYKAVMLASLRSLVPKNWDSEHEVAWSWLWENVERLIKAMMGKPAAQGEALAKLWGGLTEHDQALVRREVYAKFFAQAPTGMDYFKQSTTRLHFIADKVVAMTLEMYREPTKMVTDLSALGLRHVGYGIPTELFGPFVSAFVQVVRTLTDDDLAEESFRWSLNLISRILMRVINEGSTIVMRAINANSGKQLKKAVGCAPRSKRADWMLDITVGTQSISPLMWAIETGSLDAGKAIIIDLLTIRADRDRYYYGMDPLFLRHPDIIKRLCLDAPALLPTLLDGLVWRSRLTENGRRRVNYFVKHLLIGQEGEFVQAVEWLTGTEDPKLVCHPVIALVTDLVWSRVAFFTFLYGKSWFLLTLCVFMASQSVLNNARGGDNGNDLEVQVQLAIVCCRCFIYGLSMGSLVKSQIKGVLKDIRTRNFIQVHCVRIPAYLADGQSTFSLALTLCLFGMFVTEPILHCLGYEGLHIFTEHCPHGRDVVFTYSIFSMGAMFCYYMLLTDLSVFSTRVSAFVLVLGRVLSEVGLFLFALTFLVLMFASGISSLEQDHPSFEGIGQSAISLLKITLGMFSGSNFERLQEYPVLQITVFAYSVVTVVFVLNLLIAQLNCAYGSTYQDMLGYARLKRGQVVVEAMVSVQKHRWEQFIESLQLETPCEFGEGDVGLPGGIQMAEPASANITTVDLIRRFGGSTSPAAMWPEDEQLGGNDAEDRFEKVEKLIKKTMKRIDPSRKGGAGSSVLSSTASASNTLISSEASQAA